MQTSRLECFTPALPTPPTLCFPKNLQAASFLENIRPELILAPDGVISNSPVLAGEVSLPPAAGAFLPCSSGRGAQGLGALAALTLEVRRHTARSPVPGCKYFWAPGEKPGFLSCPCGS